MFFSNLWKFRSQYLNIGLYRVGPGGSFLNPEICWFQDYPENRIFVFLFTHLEPVRYQAALLGSLACMETIMNAEGRRMSDRACAEFERGYVTYRSSLNWLARQSLEANKARYRLRPKVHQPCHMVYDYLPLNPRKYSNFIDEDFIFKTKKIAETAHPLFMPTHVAMKYSIAVCLRWWDGPF